ncbi:predicted protein [Sclerotinia sclerotiorum 1980 UF-70]|uniref:Uncharacterized protein n=1 Tax=Sclerotinia sclerotiorum (strain ATCC 18683 / 1980 / Ss-1) TaxID=665079 RepID=A7F857_SCLS1|nr:predicted protein [Sclerotinia sclerotiorum 1980 UF-70]EDN98928.1 predicted protein [Sclerotinia sclerotiorum 1980 UF-70]
MAIDIVVAIILNKLIGNSYSYRSFVKGVVVDGSSIGIGSDAGDGAGLGDDGNLWFS